MEEKSIKSVEENQVNKTDPDKIVEKPDRSIEETPVNMTDAGTSPDKKKKRKSKKSGKKDKGKSLKKAVHISVKKKNIIKNKKIDHLGKKTTGKIKKMTRKLEKATIKSLLIKDQVEQLTKRIGRLKKNIISGKESAMPRVSMQKIRTRLKTTGLELKQAKGKLVLIRLKIRKCKEKMRKLKSGK